MILKTTIEEKRNLLLPDEQEKISIEPYPFLFEGIVAGHPNDIKLGIDGQAACTNNIHGYFVYAHAYISTIFVDKQSCMKRN